jgi:hypothetical protein
MACEDVSNWTIQFPWVPGEDGPYEIRPIQMSFKMNRRRYDYCRAKFPYEVGYSMKDSTDNPDRILHYQTIANVKYGGKTIRKLLFKPDWVDYGRKYTHIQLQDLHRSLADGSIDMKRSNISIFDAYEKIIKGAENDLIKGIRYNLPDGATVLASTDGNTDVGDATPDVPPSVNEVHSNDDAGSPEEDNAIEDVSENTEGENAFQSVKIDELDFEDVTPEDAIQKFNSIFSVQSWITDDRVLNVGIPEGGKDSHIAAPNDNRVWRYKDPQTKPGREPIKTVFVKGKYADAPGHDLSDALNVLSDKGMKDFQAVGIATRTDVPRGKSLTMADQNVKKEALEYTAKNALTEKMKDTDRGTVEIDTDNSGYDVSHPVDVSPGDTIGLVPHDKHFSNPTATSGVIGDKPPRADICAGFIHNRIYHISEIEHNYSKAGKYSVFLDLGIYPNMEDIKTSLVYYDPDNEKWIDASMVSEDGELKGSWFKSEGSNTELGGIEDAVDFGDELSDDN